MRMRRLLSILLFGSVLLLPACSKRKEMTSEDATEVSKARRFNGNYNTTFNDLQDAHMAAALKHGVKPLASRADTVDFKKKQLVRLPDELELYKTYDLTHSIPYLVPGAAELFIDIAQSFRDSLYSKDMPLYKLYLTSVLRTDEDVADLRRININASDNSVHRYGTTFDISWKRFEQLLPDTVNKVSSDRLKLVLGQVLFDMQSAERCYVKHERRQACFHITIR